MTSSGAKMGKTVAGAVWLNADMLSPYDYWQFWRDTRMPTSPVSSNCSPTMPLSEINRLAALAGPEINEAKKILATEATALVHGRGAADQAAETARPDFRRRHVVGKPADDRNRRQRT